MSWLGGKEGAEIPAGEDAYEKMQKDPEVRVLPGIVRPLIFSKFFFAEYDSEAEKEGSEPWDIYSLRRVVFEPSDGSCVFSAWTQEQAQALMNRLDEHEGSRINAPLAPS